MKALYSNYSASITELKKAPSALLEEAGDEPVAILNHNIPTAYLVPADLFGQMIEELEEYRLAALVKARLEDGSEPVEVSLDEL